VLKRVWKRLKSSDIKRQTTREGGDFHFYGIYFSGDEILRCFDLLWDDGVGVSDAEETGLVYGETQIPDWRQSRLILVMAEE
jgi:hypothetical protein